ncbi:UNVERIFIED_ORG: hypothetical protein J2W74_002025 [Methylorubrum zatmanii]
MNQHSANLTAATRNERTDVRLPAAAVRSRRIPDREAVCSAWHSLPRELQDQIGERAVVFAFDEFVCCGPPMLAGDRCFTVEAVDAAGQRIDGEMAGLTGAVAAALPGLFGTDECEPAWFDSLGLALQVGAAVECELWAVGPSPTEAALELHAAAFGPGPSALPSPILCAIALHRQTWTTLLVSHTARNASGQAEERGTYLWPAEDAEDEALTDLTMLSCGSLVDAKALLAHFRWYRSVRPQHPKHPEMSQGDAAIVAVRTADLALMLGEGSAGRVSPPAGGLAALLEAHRAAWAPYAEAPGPEVIGWDARDALDQTVDAAADAVLVAPCAGLADGAALVEHAAWYWSALEAAGPRRADGFEYDAKQLRARAGDWAMFLGAGGLAA